MRTPKPRSFALLFASLAAIGSGATAPPPGCGDKPVRDFVFQALREHPVVFLGEQHRRKEFHQFLRALLRDPRFPAAVDDVVVEFGSGRFQDVADRYVRGESVPEKDLEPVWRDTTQIVTWDSPVYREFFRAVREINAAHPGHTVRVLLGDPPIDWTAVRSASDYGKYADRDRYFADVVEKEVLARRRRALLIYGDEHVIRTGKAEPAPPHPSAGDILADERPGLSYAVFTIPPKRRLAEIGDCRPAIFATSGEIGARPFADVMEPGIMVRRIVDRKPKWIPMSAANTPPVREKADALLWLGPESTEVPAPPDVWAEKGYLAEVRRRAKIMSGFFGFDLTADLPPEKEESSPPR